MKSSVVTQKDIADSLNVSVNTVSHALRGKSDISSEMIEKVRAKAAELGYVPNTTAIRLKTGSSKTFALVYDNLVNPYFTLMASKLLSLTKERGYDVLICPSQNFKLDLHTFNELVAIQVDGIFSFLDADEEVINSKSFESSNIVLVGRLSEHNISSIYTDDYQGGRLVGEYLKSKGHQKVLYAGPEFINESSKRYQGLESVYHDSIVKIQFVDYNDALDIVELIKKEHITSVFGFNDIIAIRIQRAIIENNLDVEVVGYDAIHEQLPYVDDITSVRHNFNNIATLAVDTMFEKIEGNIDTKKVKIPVSLYIKGEKQL